MIVAQATLVKNNVIYVDAQEINQDCIIDLTHPAALPPSDQSIISPINNDIENQSFDILYAHNQIIRNERRNRFYCMFLYFCIVIVAIIVIGIYKK